MNRSPIAIQKPAKRKRWRRNACYGACYHTMGRGILARAAREDMEAIECALKWYRAWIRSRVNYLIGWDGTVYQLLDDDKRGSGVGMPRSAIRAYRDGSWRRRKNPKALAMWDAQFPDADSPLDLFAPFARPSECYIGVEMMPLPSSRVGADGLWFTPRQHQAARALAYDMADRHSWPDDWMYTPRLATHEILTPHSRWETKYTTVPWDPGAMRERPRFDLSVIWR